MNELQNSACKLLGDFFAIFAHANRMRVFCALQQGPRTVSQIAEHVGISLPNASQHLRLMRDRHAVVAEKRGQHVYYRVADERFITAAQMIADALMTASSPPGLDGTSETAAATAENESNRKRPKSVTCIRSTIRSDCGGTTPPWRFSTRR